MDIYHPVVLFKFSTKRRPSPVLHDHIAAAAFIVVAGGAKRRASAQCVSQSEPVKDGWRGGRRRLSRRVWSLLAPQLLMRGGVRIWTEQIHPRGTHDLGTEPRTHQREQERFPSHFFFFFNLLGLSVEEKDHCRSTCLYSNRRGIFFINLTAVENHCVAPWGTRIEGFSSHGCRNCVKSLPTTLLLDRYFLLRFPSLN